MAEPLALARVTGRHQIFIHQLRPLFALRLRAQCAFASTVAFDVPLKAFVRSLLADLPAILRQNAGEEDLLRPVDSRRRIATTLRVDPVLPLLLPTCADRRRCCRRCIARPPDRD